MRRLVLSLAFLVACKYDALPSLSGDGGGGDDGGGGIDACIGIGCNVTVCDPGDETSITGTVFLPNGTTPMANVDVYVPASDPGAMAHGASCTQCGPLPGDPIVKTRTGADGRFVLTNVPDGDNIPVVITIGKWRRQTRVQHLDACDQAQLPAAETRLPKNHLEGDLPRIAVSTGSADALECLVRKMGVDDSEFGRMGSPTAIHLYTDPGQGQGASMLTGGVIMVDSLEGLWASQATITPYDAVLLSCEGVANPGSKPATAMNVMKTYADTGGRIFASHYHNIWIEGVTGAQSPPVWPTLATFSTSGTNPTADITIDVSHTDGMKFSDFQVAVTGASPGHIPLQSGSGRSTAMRLDDTVNTKQFAYFTMGTQIPQIFEFDTPVEAPAAQRCGRVVFSDLHQGSGSMSMPTVPFPNGCTNTPLAPQDLAVVYMLFQMQTCVGTPP